MKIKHASINGTIRLITFVLIFSAAGFVSFKNLILHPPFIVQNEVYIQKGNIYDQFLGREPVEKMLFMFQNGDFYVFTTNHEIGVLVPRTYLYEYLFNKEKKDFSQALICIHNHPTPAPFSPADDGTYFYLKRKGFNGRFGIYYPWSKKTRWKEEE